MADSWKTRGEPITGYLLEAGQSQATYSRRANHRLPTRGGPITGYLLEAGQSQATCCYSMRASTNPPLSSGSHSRRVLIWTEPRRLYWPSNTGEKAHNGRGGLMVWAGIMEDGHTDLHVFGRSTLTGKRYRDEILSPYVRFSVEHMNHKLSLWTITYNHIGSVGERIRPI
ncbi:uncharacterized protein TNCV_1276241 [Trichonephila clavipes]|nr:uncharacterized protein TNCV_1276241 [Trichonephila clavipes]